MMYLLYFSAAIGTLGHSLFAFKHVLHPHFLTTLAIVVMFMSDFLVRGYEDEHFDVVPSQDLWIYQLLILSFCLATYGLTYFISRLIRGIRLPNETAFNIGSGSRITLSTIAWILVALDSLKRLHFSDWSIELAFYNSLGAYGAAPWNYSTGFLGDDKVVYQLIRTFLPFAGMSFCLLWINARPLARLAHITGFIVVVAFLFAEGSRIPIVVVIGACMMFYLIRRDSIVKKAIVLVAGALSIAVLASAMYLYRAGGFLSGLESAEEPFAITYHQDDNYYRAVLALHIAATTEERWDPLTFLSVIVANPVPRVLWPEKPALLADFYGVFKDEWVTISLVGELAALAGPFGSFFLSILVAVLLFLLLCTSSRLVNRPAGVIVYVLVTLYTYMVLRSLLNISQYAYLPIFGYLAFHAVNWRQGLAKILGTAKRGIVTA